VYFMSTACGRPQGREGGLAHVDACGREEGVKNPIFSGRRKWMTPYADWVVDKAGSDPAWNFLQLASGE